MEKWQKIRSTDGFELNCYTSRPGQAPTAAVIILQEIFGVNAHIQQVADRFASAGFLALAPCLFDREATQIELEYNQQGIAQGRQIKEAVDRFAESDIEALLSSVEGMKKIVIGYCWGGSLAWRMAGRSSNINAAVSSYGGELPALKELQPRCPVLAHFGRQDETIPMAGVEAFITAQPEIEAHIYDAGHGFNCDHRAQFDENAARLAHDRTMAFLSSIID